MKTKLRSILSLLLCAVLIFSVFSTVALAADLGSLAIEFNESVGAFADTTTLETEIEAISLAEARLNAYIAAGGTKEDTAIADAYLVFAEKKEKTDFTIEACDLFTDFVSEAATCYIQNDYPGTRLNLDGAAEYLPVIPNGDPYVSGAYSEYMGIISALRPQEMICESFCTYAKQAAEATTYEEIERHLKNARNAERNITIEGFIGEDEAYANIAAAEAAQKAKKTAALVFISKVQLIKHDDLESFRAAIKALEGVDVTTEGVEALMDKLDSYIDSYNEKVKAANAVLTEACRVADSVM